MRTLASWPLATLLIGVAALMGINAAISSGKNGNAEVTQTDLPDDAVSNAPTPARLPNDTTAPAFLGTGAGVTPAAIATAPGSDSGYSTTYAGSYDEPESEAVAEPAPLQGEAADEREFGWSTVESASVDLVADSNDVPPEPAPTTLGEDAGEEASDYTEADAATNFNAIADALGVDAAETLPNQAFDTPPQVDLPTPTFDPYQPHYQAHQTHLPQYQALPPCQVQATPACPATNCQKNCPQCPMAKLGIKAQAYVMTPNGPKVITSAPLAAGIAVPFFNHPQAPPSLTPPPIPVPPRIPQVQIQQGRIPQAIIPPTQWVASNPECIKDHRVDIEVHAVESPEDNPFAVFGDEAPLIEHLAMLHQRIGELRGEASAREENHELAIENAALTAKLEAVDEFHALMDGFIQKSMELTEMKAQQKLRGVHAAYAMQGASVTLPEPLDPTGAAHGPAPPPQAPQSQIDQLRRENQELRDQLNAIRAQLGAAKAAPQAKRPTVVY